MNYECNKRGRTNESGQIRTITRISNQTIKNHSMENLLKFHHNFEWAVPSKYEAADADARNTH